MNPTVFFQFVSISFRKQIAYRFDFFVGILNGFLFVYIFTSLWRALYLKPGISHNGFTLTMIVTYAVFAMVVRISFTMDDGIIPRKVRDGSIAIDLIRPVPFFYMNLAENLGSSLFHFIARGLPVLAASYLLFDVSVQPTIHMLLFPLSAILGYLILFMINFLIGMLAFWFLEIFPFLLFKYGLITIFSGGIVPIDFFPDAIKPVIALMPFQYILYAPTMILSGLSDSSRLTELLGGQIIWTLLLAFFCYIAWRTGRNKLLIQGG